MEFSVGATHCVQCINGTHRHNDEHPELGVMEGCASCSPGQQANDALDGCEPCEAGRYSEDGGSCIACNAGPMPGRQGGWLGHFRLTVLAYTTSDCLFAAELTECIVQSAYGISEPEAGRCVI